METLRNAQFFDVLVGYFRYSGFHRLHEALSDVEHIRILIGLSTGRTTVRLLKQHRNSESLDFESHAEARKRVTEDLVEQMAHTEDAQKVEDGLRAFLDFLESGRMEIRAFPHKNLHAKVYIGRYHEGLPSDGYVITGSSNFSESGLVGQHEFNVELKDGRDVQFALDKFEALWAQGVDVTEDLAETFQTRTWLTDQITPYDVFLKLLYEYFEEDINLDQDETDTLYRPDGFRELEYQTQAVTAAKKIVETHNGVFIADVVGLGKTYVTAMLVQKLQGRTLVVCPPVLEAYWRDTFIDFGIRGYRIVSLGKLDHIIQEGHDKYTTVVLDEAHRFRNEDTQRYAQLHQICFGKQVVCVSATPLNNDISDIYSLLKLFQTPRQSTIPGVRNLKAFFKRKQHALRKEKRGTPDYVRTAQTISENVRDRILKHVMVRRTRSEIEEYYEEDIKQQGLSFPELQDPRRIVYAFDSQLDAVFTRTIKRIKAMTYARYTPLLYFKGDLTPLQEQSQLNIGGFMKSILVKRLESSFHAFRKTLNHFIASYERFISLYEDGVVYLAKDVDVFDLLDNDRIERLEELIEDERVSQYEANEFNDELRENLDADLKLLRAIRADWQPVKQDPKLETFLRALHEDPVLADGPLLIFTEAADTGHYLFKALEEAFPGDVMFYDSEGGRDGDGSISVRRARRAIQQAFDPTADDPNSDYRILITTDVLAEGINLHRSNTVVNYDLPWNPTRVLQRVGRVNRVGTEHDTLYVYNIFPTAQADEELNLEANITAKIQAFHDTLGEDAKYLTEEEEVTTHSLFGNDLYERLNRTETYEGETDTGASELKYLQQIRRLRDEDRDRFEEIKQLPKKVRTARNVGSDTPGLLTFFRRGKLKRFFHVRGTQSNELTFLDAAQAFECAPDTPALSLPDDFYEHLERSKDAFDHSQTVNDAAPRVGGRSNEEYIRQRLQDRRIKRGRPFTETDQRFLQKVRRALNAGIFPDHTLKTLKRDLQEIEAPLKVLQTFRDHVPDALLNAHQTRREANKAPREVILSTYLHPPAENAT